MVDYSLSICIPSNRNLEDSRGSISSAIGFCDNTGSELVISDSSDNLEKSEMWNKIPLAFMKYIENKDKENIKWSDNWLNGIKKCSGKFIGVVSDDDIIVNLDKSELNYNNLNSDSIIGIKPMISLWASKVGIYKLNKFKIDGNTAIERVNQYFDLAAGNNTSYYSFFKGDLLKNIYEILQFHPTKGGYLDWAITLACIASGKILVDDTKLLVYKNNNWFGDQHFINKQACKLFKNCGLGEIGFHMSYLFRALDVFILVMRDKSNLAKNEKLEVAELLFNTNLQLFINNFYKYKKNIFSSDVANEIIKLNKAKNLEHKLEISLNIIMIQFSQNLKAKYKLFYEKSIGNEWGHF